MYVKIFIKSTKIYFYDFMILCFCFEFTATFIKFIVLSKKKL